MALYIPDTGFAATQQDAKDAAAVLVDTQEKVVSLELDNRRLMEQVSLAICTVWWIYSSVCAYVIRFEIFGVDVSWNRSTHLAAFETLSDRSVSASSHYLFPPLFLCGYPLSMILPLSVFEDLCKLPAKYAALRHVVLFYLLWRCTWICQGHLS